MKKILITGASGFIGSFMVEEALKQGYEVYAGVRNSSNKSYLTDPAIHFFEIDFSNRELLKEQFIHHLRKIGRFDCIIHNAGITKSYNKDNFDTVNYQYTKNLIEVLIENKCVPKKFIYMSSLAAYGPGDEKTMLPVNKSDKPHPVTFYGKSKLKSEHFIMSLPNFPYIILRPTGVYGPREKDFYVVYKTLNRHLELYIGSSNQQLSFLYVKDLARLIIKIIESEIEARSYFVTDGGHYTAQEFSRLLKAQLNKKAIKIVFPGLLVKPIAFCLEKLYAIVGQVPTLNTERYKEISCRNWLCDGSETFKDFDFKPEFDLSSGLQETIAWYKQEKLL